VRPPVREALARYGILRLLGPANVHESTAAAIDALTPHTTTPERAKRGGAGRVLGWPHPQP
jgi:hypothetical protein